MNQNDVLIPVSSEKRIGIEKIHEILESYL